MTDRAKLIELADFDAAFLTIRPLPFSTGPNFWTADVPGWGINAPTIRELTRLVRDWFVDEGSCTDCWDTGITVQTERPCTCAAALRAQGEIS